MTWESQMQLFQMSYCAVRISNIADGVSSDDIVSFCKEFGVLRGNVTGSLDIEQDQSRRYVIVEFVESGSVEKLLERYKQQADAKNETSSISSAHMLVSQAYLDAYYSRSEFQTAESIEVRARKEYFELHKVYLDGFAQNRKYEQARIDLDMIQWEQRLIDAHIAQIDRDVECFLEHEKYPWELEADKRSA
eukprot:TRINITY_DN13980_c0_g1_i1.p1 TRINITY_DN13980_c0_g1~~TRINITY_DN13980_c0_g1_i1.p1  ORF type:complete len:191 (+),score=46.84 TRINITY_DN13980_c0_g1_i1:205-777(+)